MKQTIQIRSRIDTFVLDTFFPDTGYTNKMVLCIHGFNSSKESSSYKYVGNKLLEKGIGYAIFSLPYHGERRIDASDFTVRNCLEDIDLVIESLYKHFPISKMVVEGTSFGGYLTLLKLKENKLQKESILLKSPAIKMGEIVKSFLPTSERKLMQEKGYIVLPNSNSMRINDSFFKELFEKKAEDVVINKEITIMHGKDDEVVPYGISVDFALRNPKVKIILLDGENHNYSDEGLDKVFETINSIMND